MTLLNGKGNTSSNISYQYDAFGVARKDTGSSSNPFRYSGEYYDGETGFIYLRARYYNPTNGRFLTEDTHWNPGNMVYGDNSIGLPNVLAIMQSSNLYAYCMNNPITFADPSGRKVVVEGTNIEKQEILNNLNSLTNHYVFLDDNEVLQVYIWANGVSNGVFSSGNALIMQLIESNYTCTIRRSYEGSSKNGGQTNNNRFNGIGVNTTVYFNPDDSPWIMTDVGNGTGAEARRPAYIGLGHELIHSERVMRGARLLKAANNVYGVYYDAYTELGVPYSGAFQKLERWDTEEYATIGISHHVAGDITENMLRAEHGFMDRLAYKGRY